MTLKQLLLGNVQFEASEEYLTFKYTFAMILILAGIPLLAIFIAGDMTGANRIGPHGITVRAYLLLSCILLLALRGRKHLFKPVIWVFALASLLVHISGFMLVPQDEQRLVWFYSLIVGVYVLLGRGAGALFTIASIVAVLFGNPHQAAPVSARGLGTFFTSLISLSAIFHVFTQRTTSFYQRMLESNERLRYLSDHDPLTGVLNGRAFLQACERLTRLAARHGSYYSVLFIDLDHFKQVNDQHGHDAGDTVLRTVANTLSTRLRQSDLLGRVGGEEFVVFLYDTDADGALHLAESLRHAIETAYPSISEGKTLSITASIGVAISQPGQNNLDLLQQQADQAMYISKSAGRNRVTLFNTLGNAE